MRKTLAKNSGPYIQDQAGSDDGFLLESNEDSISPADLSHGGSERFIFAANAFIDAAANCFDLIQEAQPKLVEFRNFLSSYLYNYSQYSPVGEHYSIKDDLTEIKQKVGHRFELYRQYISMSWLQDNAPSVLATMNEFLAEVYSDVDNSKNHSLKFAKAASSIESERQAAEDVKIDPVEMRAQLVHIRESYINLFDQISQRAMYIADSRQVLDQLDKKKKDEGRVKEDFSEVSSSADGLVDLVAQDIVSSKQKYFRPSRAGKKGVLVHLSEETVDKLKLLAKLHGESLQQYLTDHLQELADKHSSDEAMHNLAIEIARKQVKQAEQRLTSLAGANTPVRPKA